MRVTVLGERPDSGLRPRLDERGRGSGPTIVGMVVLIALGLSLGILLIVTMVAMTRYMLAHPDDPMVPGDGTWSGSLAGTTATPAPAAPAQLPEPVAVAPASRPVAGAGVPLDDMPAEVIAELAARLRRDA